MIAAAASFTLWAALLAPPAEPPARTAIVVGSNAAAAGRTALRHAHRDAESVAQVLRTVGRFDRARVHVLADPSPEALLAVVEREAAALAASPQGMLLFYYSGHADRDALYPGGTPLPLERLRRALDRPAVALRVGVIDACQGGGWTRAKGLVPDAPFEVAVPAVLGSEGSALIASSSGTESAHESDLLQASFFTYHFAAALRGAGDRSGDGVVTLTEAFEYARERTIRDSARSSPEPQHPSYALNVRGRQDIVLAHVADSPSTLDLEQRAGPLELVHLGTGLRVLELPAGPRRLTLAVPPGRYLVRRVAADGVRTRELTVPRDGAASVSESELVLLGTERLAVKGDADDEAERGEVAPVWPRAGGGEVELGLQGEVPFRREELHREYTRAIGTGESAVATDMVRFDARLGITDRLAWKVGTLGFAYRFGERGGVEVVPYAGLLSWKKQWRGSYPVDDERRIGGGLGVRVPFSWGALVLTGGLDQAAVAQGTDLRYQTGLGITLAGRYVTLHLAAGVTKLEQADRDVVRLLPGHTDTTWWFGSQELGLASLPLLRVGPLRGWSADLYVAAASTLTARVGLARTF